MNRYCPKHPNQKLIQLFTSAICDICSPSSNTSSKTQNYPDTILTYVTLNWSHDYYSLNGYAELEKFCIKNEEELNYKTIGFENANDLGKVHVFENFLIKNWQLSNNNGLLIFKINFSASNSYCVSK